MIDMTEQLEAARADAKEAEAYAEELAKDQVDLCRQLIAAEDKLAKAVEALKEALYFLNPTESDMEKRAGIYRIVTTLAEIEGEKG
jgi:phage shock protein A